MPIATTRIADLRDTKIGTARLLSSGLVEATDDRYRETTTHESLADAVEAVRNRVRGRR